MIGEFAKSVGRLYRDDRISKETVDDLHNRGKLTDDEYKYVLAMKSYNAI